MALKQLEPTVEHIGDMTFHITPFPALKCANITGELANVLAPLLTAFVGLVGENDKGLFDVDVNRISDVFMGCTSINGDKIEKLIEKLLLGGNISLEHCDDSGNMEVVRLNKDILNEIFCGEIQDMFILCYYVIRLNYNGFFKKFANQSGKVRLAGKTPRKII